MALVITLFKAAGKQLAYEQAIREQTLAGILMKTEVGSTSISVSLNPSNCNIFQIWGFSISLMIYAWRVCVLRENHAPNPHLQNSQKSSQADIACRLP